MSSAAGCSIGRAWLRHTDGRAIAPWSEAGTPPARRMARGNQGITQGLGSQMLVCVLATCRRTLVSVMALTLRSVK